MTPPPPPSAPAGGHWPVPSLRELLVQPAFRLGLRDMAAPQLGIAAWGLVTGVAMIKSGLTLPLALFMSLVVYAGSAQLAVLPLMATGAPLWVIWLTAACVNLRFVIFSTLWRSYFQPYRRAQRLLVGFFSADLLFVTFLKRYPDQQAHPDQWPYFWGGASICWLAWQGSTLAGLLLAHAIPLHWGLSFAGVLALLGVLLSMLQSRATWAAAGVSASAAVAAYALPLKLNILVAIAAAVAVGLVWEAAESRLKERRRVVD